MKIKAKSLIKWWHEIKDSCLHLSFPAQCLHCQERIPPSPALLCPPCSSLLELINPQERCFSCFDLKETGYRCTNCEKFPSLFFRRAAVFDYLGPASTLVKQLKYAHKPYLAKGMGAFLLAQWDQLNWPLPDAIVPVPLSLSHWLQRGFNQSALLADELGKLLQVPVWPILKRTSNDFSQAALTLRQRRRLGQVFALKKNRVIQDKKLLVIDDVMTSGSTLNKCAEALSEGFPGTLYALTFCRAVDR